MKTYLIGVALAVGLIACKEEPRYFPPTPAEVVQALKDSTLPVEKKEIEACYTLDVPGDDIERKPKMQTYKWTVGDATVEYKEKVVDAYKSIVGDLHLETPQVDLFDIGADGLDNTIYPLAKCKSDEAKTDKKATAKKNKDAAGKKVCTDEYCVQIVDGGLRFFDKNGNEWVGDAVYALDGDEYPIANVLMFTEPGLQQVKQAYTSELEKILEAANRK